ncbi:MAG: hypothetical protein AVO38_04260 [delta proteobacterium ML8_D]|nr:MAG: hypothetical protein AVO38_04260 [delta proteobacterium ML8_D]
MVSLVVVHLVVVKLFLFISASLLLRSYPQTQFFWKLRKIWVILLILSGKKNCKFVKTSGQALQD